GVELQVEAQVVEAATQLQGLNAHERKRLRKQRKFSRLAG
ncbi:hypothetical protein HaLaN_31920, partial [Haematococcus lacustris]